MSGNLGFECLRLFPGNYEIVCIFTDRRSTPIIEWAGEKNIPLFVGNPRGGRAANFIKGLETDILFSINYLFIIEEDLIKWPSKYSFNIHGSLLPKYRGRTPHVWAIINGEKETGATVHFIDENCDTGDIVLQCKIEITNDMTGADILDRFFHLYPQMIETVLQQVSENKVEAVAQDNTQSTYFGLRTPESGRIDWSWNKEKVYNWVRAQAIPYPQAFSFIEGNKIKINKIKFSEFKIDENQPDGIVLSVDRGTPVIKTPNGAVSLEEFETESFEISAGQVLL